MEKYRQIKWKKLKRQRRSDFHCQLSNKLVKIMLPLEFVSMIYLILVSILNMCRIATSQNLILYIRSI